MGFLTNSCKLFRQKKNLKMIQKKLEGIEADNLLFVPCKLVDSEPPKGINEKRNLNFRAYNCISLKSNQEIKSRFYTNVKNIKVKRALVLKIKYNIYCTLLFQTRKQSLLKIVFPDKADNYSKAIQHVRELLGYEDLLVQIYV